LGCGAKIIRKNGIPEFPPAEPGKNNNVFVKSKRVICQLANHPFQLYYSLIIV
jgi:hypothetical protein